MYTTFFSVLIDVDDNKKEGEKYQKLCEEQFLKRLQKWNKNDGFKPRTYEDLKYLPCLLAVVEKGKMGITYPNTLRWVFCLYLMLSC